MNKWGNIFIPRDVLLVEIERRCADPQCSARTRIGLTKEEASAYCGFECERCKRWTDDLLTEHDVPDWWEELTITGLHAMRKRRTGATDDAGEVVTRMSDNYRRLNIRN